jgi:CelD/BcsL family acetyltransferase involved in cellulose biosynthesis
MDSGFVLRTLDDVRWSAFVDGCRDALPFHQPKWAAMLGECYGFRTFCLTLEDASGGIVAGVPVAEVRRWGRPPRWVSLPFTDHCPLLTRDGATPDLAEELDDVRRAFGATRFEVRDELRGRNVFPTGTFYAHALPLEGSNDDIFASFHANQVRRNIRRAERTGVKVRIATAESDLTDVFYWLHARTRHRLGVPVQPRRYFRLLWRRVLNAGLGIVMIAELDGVPVGAGVFLASDEVCVYKYGASDERSWSSRPNHLVFWEAIRWAAAKGCRAFDFGRTDTEDEGLRTFKSRWGTVERKLTYSVLADRAVSNDGSGVPASVRSIIRHGPKVVPRVLGEMFYRYTA